MSDCTQRLGSQVDNESVIHYARYYTRREIDLSMLRVEFFAIEVMAVALYW